MSWGELFVEGFRLHFVEGEPYGRQRDEPEEEESHEVASVGSARLRHGVLCTSCKLFDGVKLECDALSVQKLGHIARNICVIQLPPIHAYW